MSIQLQQNKQKGSCTLEITGRFDFEQHGVFREHLKQLSHQTHCVVNLTEAEFMNSSALGLLLLLKGQVSPNHPEGIELRYRKGSVIEEVLEAAQFNRLFKMVAV